MYGNYGLRDDLSACIDKKVDLNGSVLLLRAGRISFADKVTKHISERLQLYLPLCDCWKCGGGMGGHTHFIN